jgi:ferrous iron transport protein A
VNASSPQSALCLAKAQTGGRFRVVQLAGQPETCHRLREMGFCESAEIQKISGGAALICKICGVRMALSHHLARNVFVEPLAAAEC